MKLTEGQKRAIEKLDAEMEKAKDPCSKYIAEQLLQLATSCPEVAKKILGEKKTLTGALGAIKKEAKKHAVGGCDLRGCGCASICDAYKKYKFILTVLNKNRQAKARAASECRMMRDERIAEWRRNRCWPKG